MRTLTVKLDATDTPKSISVLAGLGTAVNGWADPAAKDSKARNWVWFRVYAEQTNNSGANGPARLTFEKTITQASFVGSRTASPPTGQPLIPNIAVDFLPPGTGALYDSETISITGQQNDVFQIEYATL